MKMSEQADTSLIDRVALADMILARIECERDWIKAQYDATREGIPLFWVDDLLPVEIAREIRAAFPPPGAMKLKRTLREHKYIAAQMDQYATVLEEAVYAFQDPRVVHLISEMTGVTSLHPDEHLYAGGISMMGGGHFLNPHVDNSHDKDRARWRVFNLLYYVTEDWKEEFGGNLELWPDGVGGDRIEVHSKFNRLVVMATHDSSWHSVNPIVPDRFRCCVSNYYFSDEPLRRSDHFHVTSFRGRPEQPVTDQLLKVDALLRTGVRKIMSKGVGNKDHVYKRRES